VAPGGTIVNVGVHGAKVELHLERLWAQNITITDIRERGEPVQSSMDSFSTREEAEAAGLAEMEKLVKTRRIGQ
jgi:threonine dehydrogenase-like Zn-dependent dehydrogenase